MIYSYASALSITAIGKIASGSEAGVAHTIESVVIAGAGQAGGRAAEALRARGFRAPSQ